MNEMIVATITSPASAPAAHSPSNALRSSNRPLSTTAGTDSRNEKRAASARFSFLLSVPAVVLSGLFELRKALDGEWAAGADAGDVIVATIISFIVGYAAIAFLLRWLGSHNTAVFVVYRV